MRFVLISCTKLWADEKKKRRLKINIFAFLPLRCYIYGNFLLPLPIEIQSMEQKPKFQIAYMEEAIEFLESLPPKAKNKSRLQHRQEYVQNRQGNFQEIGKFRDLGVPYPVQRHCLQAFLLLGHGQWDFGRRYAWDNQENAKDTGQGDSQSGSIEERIFQQ